MEKTRVILNCSLRSKRFRRAFRRFEAFFASWTRENWGERKKVREGGGEGRKGNAYPQTPRFWKTRSSTNGISWLARHGSVDCQVINPSIKSGMFIWAWPAWTQRTGSRYRGILLTITIFTWSSSQDHFCPDPTADLKDLRQAFSDTEESTRTFLRQGLLPDRAAVLIHKWIDCFDGVWETADSLPIALRITSNNAPKFRIFRAQELHRHTVRK